MDLTSYMRISYNQLKKSHKFVDIVTVFLYVQHCHSPYRMVENLKYICSTKEVQNPSTVQLQQS